MERIPTVGVVILQGENVLLVEHGEAAGHMTGSFGLPAGRLDEGEELIDAAVREVKEETGLTVNKEDLIEIPKKYEADLKRKNNEVMHSVFTVYATDKFEGELMGSDETTPLWVTIDSLGQRELLPNIEEAVELGQQILKNE